MKGQGATAVTWSGWNFCNGAKGPFTLEPYTHPRIPRLADCWIHDVQRITPYDNEVRFDQDRRTSINALARHKEWYLARKCQYPAPAAALKGGDNDASWNVSGGWHVMFKSGIVNTKKALEFACPCSSLPPHRCQRKYTGPGSMNQPFVVHGMTNSPATASLGPGAGYYAGTYDIGPDDDDDDDYAENHTSSVHQRRSLRRRQLEAALHQHMQDWIQYWQAEQQQRQPGNQPVPPEPRTEPQPPWPMTPNSSFLFTVWSRRPDPTPSFTTTTNATTKLVFYQGVRTSPSYPSLMNYLRSNQVKAQRQRTTSPTNDGFDGGYGGYPWGGFGVMQHAVGTYGALGTTHLHVTVQFRSIPHSDNNNDGEDDRIRMQFYLPEWGGCWKLDGSPCTGGGGSPGHPAMDWPKDDVTRYICFVALPSPSMYQRGCSPLNLHKCPPYHILSSSSSSSTQEGTNGSPPSGLKVYRNDTQRFPYHCYFLHCYAPNDPTAPVGETCDPYSNPNPQEILQLLPCEEWGEHGFPTQPLTSNDTHTAMTFHLDVGSLGARVFLQGHEPPLQEAPFHDPNSSMSSSNHTSTTTSIHQPPDDYATYPGWNRRVWESFEIGPEYTDRHAQPETSNMIRWEVQDWDVQIPIAAAQAMERRQHYMPQEHHQQLEQ